jgi:ABC-2 type transport system permease protein
VCADTGAITRRPRLAVARAIARPAARSAIPLGAVFALYIASSAWGYATTYPTAAERLRLVRAFGANVGIDAIIGPAQHIDTVSGFTAWRSVGVLGIVGAVWGLLLATRLLRGEEDAGRWELLLAGPTTRRAAAAQALAGLALAAAIVWVLPLVATVLIGRSDRIDLSMGQSLWLVSAVTSAAVMFAAVGSCTAQLAETRRRATAMAAAVLGMSYALRMVADSGTGLAWLRWATPLGWIEELRPGNDPNPIAIVPVATLIVGAVAGSVQLAGRRDLGGGVLRDRTSRPPRTGLLAGPTGLTVRLLRPVAIGWISGIALGGLLIGLVAKSAGRAMADSPSFRDTLTRLGTRGAGAQAYLGIAFLTIALLVALVAAGQLANALTEEADGRLEQLLTRPVGRAGWLAGRIAVVSTVVLLAAVLAAVGVWIGTASQHSGLSFWRIVLAGLNVAAPASVVIGIGVLALGIRPRLTTIATYGLVVWSFLVQIVGSIVGVNRWLLDTSLFHHMAPAPAVDPRWTADLAMVAVAAALTATGCVGYARRDHLGE